MNSLKILFWLHGGRKTIFCRLTVCGIREEISTGIKVPNRSLWDSSLKEVKGDKVANALIAEMNLFFRRQELLLDTFTAEGLKQAWLASRIKKGGKASPFICDIIPPHSGKAYDALLNHLKTYTNRRLSKLDQEWADNFVVHLLKYVQPSSASLYISKLRAVLNRAIEKFPRGDEYPDMITEIPFKGPEIRAEQSKSASAPKYLTVKQYEALKTLNLTLHDDFFRQCFLWQCATGQSFADMKAFHPDLLSVSMEGDRYIEYSRAKTNIEAIVPLLPEALQAMHDISDWDQVRRMNERTYNRNLIKIGKEIGFERMTSHIGRHTFGVLRLIDGYSMESVQKMMGHSSIRMTESVYAVVTLDKLFKEKREIS